MEIPSAQPLAPAVPLDGPLPTSGDPGGDDPFFALLAALLQPQAPPVPSILALPTNGQDAPQPAAASAALPIAVVMVDVGPPDDRPDVQAALADGAVPVEPLPARVNAAEAAEPSDGDAPEPAAVPPPAAPPSAAGEPEGDEHPAPVPPALRPIAPSDSPEADRPTPDATPIPAGGSESPVHARAPEPAPDGPDPDAAAPVLQRLPDALPADPALGRSQPVASAATPVQAMAAPASITLPGPDHRGRVVSARLVVAQDGQGSSVRIDLEPADLGRVEVALHVDDAGMASATFTVDRPETLQLLQRDARTVGDLLGSAGFAVQQGALGFTLRDSPGGQHGSERGQRGGGGAPVRGGPAVPTPPRAGRRGLLDLQV